MRDKTSETRFIAPFLRAGLDAGVSQEQISHVPSSDLGNFILISQIRKLRCRTALSGSIPTDHTWLVRT